jgi:DNA-binding XRE family transcriptional regulator
MNEILEIRKQFKTQKEMANVIGVSEATVSDWLKGKKNISVSNAKKIAFMFNVDRANIRPGILK